MTALSEREDLVGATPTDPVVPSVARSALTKLYDFVKRLDARGRGAQETIGIYHVKEGTGSFGVDGLPVGWFMSVVDDGATERYVSISHSLGTDNYSLILSSYPGRKVRFRNSGVVHIITHTYDVPGETPDEGFDLMVLLD